MKVENAKISSVRIGNFERYWGAQICVNYNGSGQCVYFPLTKIAYLLYVFDVQFWEDLPGISCRTKHDHAKIFAIGNFIKDKWVEI